MGNGARRELKTRQQQWVKTVTQWLVATSITPNQISLLSLVFSVLAGGSLYLFSTTSCWYWLIVAPVCIQLRLLCNMLDGLVAVEGGKGTASGELFNDIPDRLADVVIIVSIGFATLSPEGLQLSWLAAILAVMTAYIRTLGGCLGAPVLFIGPMAKQHRMALTTVASLLGAMEYAYFASHYVLLLALVVMTVGSAITCYRRTKKIYDVLERSSQS